MPISDELLKAIMAFENVTEAEQSEWLERTLSERDQAGDDRNMRSIRQRQLKNPTGSSTPLEQQISNSEQYLYRLQEKAAPLLKELAPKLLAIELQSERVAKLKQAEAEARAAHTTRQEELHHDYRSFCDRLMQLGATPTKLGDLRQQEQAILADLIRWKVADPRFEDPENPWRDLNAVYAARALQRIEAGERPPPLSSRAMSEQGQLGRDTKRYWKPNPTAAMDDVREAEEISSARETAVHAISSSRFEEVASSGDGFATGSDDRNVTSTPSSSTETISDGPVRLPGRGTAMPLSGSSTYAQQIDPAELALQFAKKAASASHRVIANQEKEVIRLDAENSTSIDDTYDVAATAKYFKSNSDSAISANIKSDSARNCPTDITLPLDRPSISDLDEATARLIAEALVSKDPDYFHLYWPVTGIAPFDYHQERLIAALEAEASDEKRRWRGGLDFLDAARLGQAREFIGHKRRIRILYLAKQLLAGDEEVITLAQQLDLLA